MTTRRELAALQRKVNRAMPPITRPVKIFIKESVIDPTVNHGHAYDIYFDTDGNKFFIKDLQQLRDQGVELIIVTGIDNVYQYPDLDVLTDEELDQLEKIQMKLAGIQQ